MAVGTRPKARRRAASAPAQRAAAPRALPRLPWWRAPDGLLEAGWLAIAALAPLVFLFTLDDAFELPKQALLRVLLTASLSAATCAALARPRLSGARPWLSGTFLPWLSSLPVVAGLAVLAAWGLATATSVAPEVSFWGARPRYSGFVTQIGVVTLFIAVASVLRTRRQATRLAQVVAGVTVVAALYAFLQRSFLIRDFVPLVEAMRPHATFGNPIFFGDYLTLAIPLTAALALATRGQEARLALWAAAGVETIALLLTQSRGPLLGVVAGAFLFVVLYAVQRGGPWRRWLAGGVAAALLALAVLFLGQAPLRAAGLGRFADIVNPSEGAASVRITLWQAAGRIWASRPITGWGPDMMGSAIPRQMVPRTDLGEEGVAESWDRVHNATLDGLGSGGALGELALLGIAVLAACSGWRLLRPAVGPPGAALSAGARGPSLAGSPLVPGMLAGLAGYVVAQQTSIETTGASSLAWMLAGCLAGCAGLRFPFTWAGAGQAEPAAHAVPQRRTWPAWAAPAAGAAALALTAAVTWTTAQWLISDAEYKSGYAYAGAGKAPEAIAAYQRATAAWSHESRTWHELAYAQMAVVRGLPDARARDAFKDVLSDLEHALAVNPAWHEHWNAIGELSGEEAARFNDPALADRARAAHAHALELAPLRWRSWMLAGTTELRLGHFDDAKRDLERAVALQPDNFLVWSRLGDTAVSRGDRAAARTAYQRALQIEPSRAEIRKALDALGPGRPGGRED